MEYTIEDVIWAFEPFLSEKEVDVINSRFGYLIVMRDRVANDLNIFRESYSEPKTLLQALLVCVKSKFAEEKSIDDDKISGPYKDEFDERVEVYLNRLKSKTYQSN